MNINTILDEEQVTALNNMIMSGCPYKKARQLYPKLTSAETSVFFAYFKNYKARKEPPFGHKSEAYNPSEDYDELHPQYKWEDLDETEINFYNKYSLKLNKNE